MSPLLHHLQTQTRSPLATSAILRIPKVTINNRIVVESVAHKKRYHLGSTLYTPVISPVYSKSPGNQSSAGYAMTPMPIPRFSGKENCTFTIRVPRMYLERAEREEICNRRALWGAGIYTDDSDPIAVAIHSGWIRGEWSGNIDLSWLSLGKTEDRKAREENGASPQTAPATADLVTKPPEMPMVPVPNMDLHINLLILPTLASYASLVCHGLKSRPWTTKHDGLSYKVDSIAWVDEKSRRGQERGGEARRKRLKAVMESSRLQPGPSLKTSFLPSSIKALQPMALVS